MIWCVEDDSGIREIEVYTLNSTGFEARGFSDGASFREAPSWATWPGPPSPW